MYQLCLFLTKGSLYCLFDLFIFHFENDQNKDIKEEIENNTKVQTNAKSK